MRGKTSKTGTGSRTRTTAGLSNVYWLSSKRMTVSVETNDSGILIDVAPIVRVFIGQHINNLRNWMSGHCGFMEHRYKKKELKIVKRKIRS